MNDQFRHRWDEIRRTPADQFESQSFEDVSTDSTSWDLPPEWSVVVRVETDTGQIIERAFRTTAAANHFVNEAESKDWGHSYYNAQVMHTTYPVTVEEGA